MSESLHSYLMGHLFARLQEMGESGYEWTARYCSLERWPKLPLSRHHPNAPECKVVIEGFKGMLGNLTFFTVSWLLLTSAPVMELLTAIYCCWCLRHQLPLQLLVILYFQHLLIMSSSWKIRRSSLNCQISLLCKAHMAIFIFLPVFIYVQYEHSCLLFSHHLLAKTASKQIWPFYIANGGAYLTASQQRIDPFKQEQANSVISLSLSLSKILPFSCVVVQRRLNFH